MVEVAVEKLKIRANRFTSIPFLMLRLLQKP